MNRRLRLARQIIASDLVVQIKGKDFEVLLNPTKQQIIQFINLDRHEEVRLFLESELLVWSAEVEHDDMKRALHNQYKINAMDRESIWKTPEGGYVLWSVRQWGAKYWENQKQDPTSLVSKLNVQPDGSFTA